MYLPYNYDDLLNDDFGLDTNSATTRETIGKDISEKDIESAFLDSVDTMVDWTSSDYLSDDVWNNLTSECVSGMFSKTFFDDLLNELELDNTHDSFFAQTEPSQWCRPSFIDSRKVFIKSDDIMWGVQRDKCNNQIHKRIAEIVNAPPYLGQGTQQSLLRPHLRNAGVPVINLITNTPPISDTDDESRISFDCEDSLSSDCPSMDDLTNAEFIGDDQIDDHVVHQPFVGQAALEVPGIELNPGPSNVNSFRCNMQAHQNDHSYHKDKNSMLMMPDAGMDTPSDSEEEIDVVSVSDKKFPVGTRMGYIPPTNPPNGRRRVLQRPSESSNVNVRNIRSGLKVMFPASRKLQSANDAPTNRRVTAPAKENKTRKPRQPRQPRQARTNKGRRRRKNNYNGCENDSPMEKRNIHNNMERLRRVGLRDSFTYLRRLVPSIQDNPKASKVCILREAAKFCDELMDRSDIYEDKIKLLRMTQAKLKWKLSCMRRENAKMSGVLDESFI